MHHSLLLILEVGLLNQDYPLDVTETYDGVGIRRSKYSDTVISVHQLEHHKSKAYLNTTNYISEERRVISNYIDTCHSIELTKIMFSTLLYSSTMNANFVQEKSSSKILSGNTNPSWNIKKRKSFLTIFSLLN